MSIAIISAASENNVIGKNNDLPWYLPADLTHFKNLTSGKHIVMGRKTYESVGRPLPNRVNIVVSRNPDFVAEGCKTVTCLADAISIANGNDLFVCGGSEIYKQALEVADIMYLTRIHAVFKGDTYFPSFDENRWTIVDKKDCIPDEKNKYSYSFITYKKTN